MPDSSYRIQTGNSETGRVIDMLENNKRLGSEDLVRIFGGSSDLDESSALTTSYMVEENGPRDGTVAVDDADEFY